ncbi:MAG TPA: outer membrane protein [Pseudolabrys sp.]|nr:outer membrane protein [Pseudolabrys sp.]
MKTSLLTGVSVSALLLAGGAQAADMPARPVYKAPAVAPAPWNWSGFYVGGTLGGIWSRNSIADGPPGPLGTYFGGGGSPSSLDNNGSGVIGGLELGYNWQISNVVLGVEADLSATSVNRTLPFFADTFSTKLPWLSTVRGRVGFAFDRFLVYGTGGAAFANLSSTYVSAGFPFVVGPNSTATGWAAGGGVEYAVAGPWTVKAEYLHVGFSDRTAVSSSGGYNFTFKDSADIGRVGINYKF